MNSRQCVNKMWRLPIAAISTLSTFATGSLPVKFLVSPSRRSISIGSARAFLAIQNVRSLHVIGIPRGGGGNSNGNIADRSLSTDATTTNNTAQKYVKLSDPAPGSPFHLALPVHDLEVAKEFYGNVLGCAEGRSSAKWQDYSLHGHQIVCHWVGNDYKCQDYFNPVDGDEVPVPHFGLALKEDEFHALAERLRKAGIQFIIEPHLRFKGQPGEQWTMFFKDPSGNNLEFKAMTNLDNLFAKYNVVD